MSSALTETSVFDATVNAVDDGDTRNAASVRTTFTQINNRAKWLNDNKAPIASPTFTGTATFANATFPSGLNLTGGKLIEAGGHVGHRTDTPTDADVSIADDISEYRVPAITANRTYTFSATAQSGSTSRRRVRVTRMRTADAFTVTVKRNDGTTIGVISASAAGWIEFCCPPGTDDWVVSAFGGTVTSLSTDPS